MKIVTNILIIVGIVSIGVATIDRFFLPGPIAVGALKTNAASALIFSNSLILIALGLDRLTK